MPRRMRWRVILEKKLSTALSQDPEVGEMEDPARMAGEPGFDLGMLVGGVIVEDGVDHFAGRHGALDGIEKADEFLVSMALHAAAVHDAVEGIEGGEQGGGAVPFVIVRHGSALAGFHRESRLGAVERLDLRFLVDREHDRVGWRMHIEADDIFHLLGQSQVGGALEGAQAMRLQPVGTPDALHGVQRQADVVAIARPVQWVISPGGSPQVNASTLLTVSIATGFLPGGRVLSCSRPATPASAYRRCQRHTAGRLTPARSATCSTGSRSAESRTMRARCTCFTGRVRSPMIASKRARSSSLTTTQSSWAIRVAYHILR